MTGAWIMLIGFAMATVLSIMFMMGCNKVNRRYDEQIDEMMRINKELVDRAERRGLDD
jgi:heme O synthase-like polyprenyltransferase